jgi:replicative DNA helicase
MTQAFDSTRVRRLPGASGRVPPHDLDAEESLLGAMLLSRDAIASALECCGAEDFYKPAHALIFDAVCALYTRGEPVDPVTVSDELRRSGTIEAIGEPSILLSLQVNTPSTANASHYARIVEEHSLLRKLVGVAGEIAELGYSVPEDVSEAIDSAEAMVFEVAQRRVVDTMSPIRDLLAQSLDHLEALVERGETITGVASGYTDLDERLAGLQRSNLVVVGARPSMGKALAIDTPVATPACWTAMGELRVGDDVFDEKGQSCRVSYVSPVFFGHRCYRVCFDDGSSLIADAGHRWLVHELGAEDPSLEGADDEGLSPRLHVGRRVDGAFGERKGRVVTTHDMADEAVKCPAGHPGWYVRLADPLEMPESDLPVHPYVLGCRLGDSCCGEDMGTVSSELEMSGLSVGTPRHIPQAYLRASPKQRLALLQGLMDSAGTVNDEDGSAEICLPERCLVEQAHELACSLGHKPFAVTSVQTRTPGGDSATDWCLRWTPIDPVFTGPEETESLAAAWAQPETTMHLARSITSIDEVPSVPVRCISVDSPSHLFLAGRSMIPTHNTSFALGAITHAAVHSRTPVLMFSLEMSHLELTQRMLCSEARVDAVRMRNGRLLESDWPKISTAIGRLGDSPIYLDDNPNVTIMDIRAKARRLKAREGLGLVVVDYLQLMTSQGRSRAENRQVEVSEISRGLKVLARELDIPVIALSQLSRNLEMRQDKRPVLADLRESGSIEQDADVVLFIYRDELYNSESPDRGTAEIIIAKHRNGPTGVVQLAFVDHHTRFANIARV